MQKVKAEAMNEVRDTVDGIIRRNTLTEQSKNNEGREAAGDARRMR